MNFCILIFQDNTPNHQADLQNSASLFEQLENLLQVNMNRYKYITFFKIFVFQAKSI